MTDTPRKIRYRGATKAAMEFLSQHPDREFSAEIVAENVVLPVQPVRQALSAGIGAGRVVRGSAAGLYRYANGNGAEPESEPGCGVTTNSVMEVLKCRPNGEVALIDENGDFWIARKVDF